MNLFKRKETSLPDFWINYANSFSGNLSADLKDVRFLVLDTETTGFDTETDRILCIGALVLKNKTIAIQESFEVYVKQPLYHPKSVQIHGILKDENKKCITELEALRQLLAFLKDAVIVAHHAAFDLAMINNSLKRHGLPKLRNKVLDTAALYKRTLIKSPLLERKESYSLDDLADKFNISKKDRHTALGDAYITAIAFMVILGRLEQKKQLNTKSLLR
ncbi:MAG: 3'-5' exonuclease [Flavobacteriaceae bacterium]